MFKVLTLGVLFYFLYRMVFGSSFLKAPQDAYSPHKPEKEDGKGEYIDYEEIE